MATANATFTTYMGIAVDANNGQLSTEYNAGTTSIVLTNINGTIGTSGFLVILDGPLTETVAVSGFTGSTVTVGATVNSHVGLTYAVFQTTAGPSNYLPLEKFTPEDVIDQLSDTAYVGSAITSRGYVQGVRTSSVSIDGAVFADTVPFLVAAIFGFGATVSGTGPFVYAYSLKNTTNGQPSRYLLYNYDGTNTRIFSGRFTDITFTMDAKALLKYTAKFLSRVSGVVSNPTSSFSAIQPIQTWTGSTTIAGTAQAAILSGEVAFARQEVEAIPNIDGSQDPYDIFVGALKATFKFTAAMQDDTQLANYENGTQPTLDFKFVRGPTSIAVTGAVSVSSNATVTAGTGTSFFGVAVGDYVTSATGATFAANTKVTAVNAAAGTITVSPVVTTGGTSVLTFVTGQGIEFHMNDANYSKATVTQQGKAYVTNEIEGEAVGNATDVASGGAGLSPALVTITNGTSAGVYL